MSRFSKKTAAGEKTNFYTLAIDTSGSVCSVTILNHKDLLFNLTSNLKTTHSEKLLYLIDSALKETSLTLEDIDLFASGIGPGSFTGIRISIATVNSFKLSLGKKIVGINTLESYANRINIINIFSKDEIICAVTDAFRNEIYCSYFLRDLESQAMIEVQKPFLTKISDIYFKGSELTLIGNCIEKYKKEIKENKYIKNIFEIGCVTSYDIGKLAYVKYKNDILIGEDYLSPLYIRKSDAEVNLGIS